MKKPKNNGSYSIFWAVISLRSIVPGIEYTENAPFSNRDSSSVIWRQFIFLVLIERATLREHDSVYFIKFLIKKPNCLQGFLKATFDLCALTRKTGQYKLRLS